MTELNQHQVERRFQIASSNPVPVNIPGLDGLFFKPLTQGQKGMSGRAYSKALMGYLFPPNAEDALPSEHLLPKMLRKAVEASGLTMDVLKHKGGLYKKTLTALTPELAGPYDQLTDAEVAELPIEKQQERQAAIDDHNRRMQEALYNAYTADERDQLNQIAQIEALEQHLRQQTAEFAARRDQEVFELLLGAVAEDGKPYFKDVEEIAAIDPAEALVKLLLAWYQFREGQPSDFFSRS